MKHEHNVDERIVGIVSTVGSMLLVGLALGPMIIGMLNGADRALIGFWIGMGLFWSALILIFLLAFILETTLLFRGDPDELPDIWPMIHPKWMFFRPYRSYLNRCLKKSEDDSRRLEAFLSLMVLEKLRPSPERSQEAFILALNDLSQALQKAALESMHRLPDEQALALIHNRMRNEPDPTSRAQLDWFANIHQQRIRDARHLSERTPLNEYGELLGE